MRGIRIKTLLSGEYDSDDAIVSCMQEPAARSPVTGRQCFTACIQDGHRTKDFLWRVLDSLDGDEAGIKSITFQINGENAYGYLKSEQGCTPSGAHFTV